MPEIQKAPDSLDHIWGELSTVFRPGKGMRPSGEWFRRGFSGRLLGTRLQKLESSRCAKDYNRIVQACNVEDLSVLRDMAVVNLEQAQVASRLTIIMNFSIYLAGFVLFNQIFPGKIQEFLSLFWTGAAEAKDYIFLNAFIVAIVVAIFMFFYAMAGVNMARDLKNLLDLSLIRKRMPIDGAPQNSDDADADAIAELPLS